MRALLLLLVGCAPAVVHIPPPTATSSVGTAPIRVDYPVDLRLNADGGWFDGSAQGPVVVYGDVNLRPHPADALYLATKAALTNRGLVATEDAGWSVRTKLIEWRGTRQTSDARWVSTLNRGTAGWVGGFFYPHYMGVDALVRVEVRDEAGRLVAERYAVSQRQSRVPARMAVSYMWLFLREPSKEAFSWMFAETTTELADEIATIASDAMNQGTTEVGAPVQPYDFHVLHVHGDEDTFSRLTDQDAVVRATRKYGDARMSAITGHDLHRGGVVGHFSVPLDTMGYDIGLRDGLHGLVDLTVLGFYNRFSLGLRGRLAEVGDTQLAAYGWGGTQFSVLDVELVPPKPGEKPSLDAVWSPRFGGWTAGVGLQFTHRQGDVTPFVRVSAFRAEVQRAFPELFPDVEEGSVDGVTIAPGLETQLTPTVAAAFSATVTRSLTEGALPTTAPFEPYVVVPSVSIGLR